MKKIEKILLISLFYSINLQSSVKKQEVIFANTQNILLAGSLSSQPDKPHKTCIIMTHGAANDRTANGLFTDLIPTLLPYGDVLNFDMSGHGKSQDAIFHLEQSVDDVKAAIKFCKHHGYTESILIGHSLGGYASLAAYDSSVKAIILLGALSGAAPAAFSWKNFCSPEQLTAMERSGYMIIPCEGSTRPYVHYRSDYAPDTQTINQEQLFKNIAIPILFINGTEFPESVFADLAQKAVLLATPGSKTIVIPHATHSFLESIAQLQVHITEWLKA